MRNILIGVIGTLILLALFYGVPSLAPSTHWPSFGAGVVTTILTAVVGWYTFLILLFNRH